MKETERYIHKHIYIYINTYIGISSKQQEQRIVSFSQQRFNSKYIQKKTTCLLEREVK